MRPSYSVLLAAATAAGLSACSCRDESGTTEFARSGKFTVSLYYRSCRGEPTSVEVSVDSADKLPSGGPGNVFSGVLPPTLANALTPVVAAPGDSGVYVWYDPRVQVRRKNAVANGFRVFYGFRPADFPAGVPSNKRY